MRTVLELTGEPRVFSEVAHDPIADAYAQALTIQNCLRRSG